MFFQHRIKRVADLAKHPIRESRGRPLVSASVIGNPYTAPPGRCGSPCRGRGAGIWRWSRRSWRAAGRVAGGTRRAPRRRRGRDGWSPPPGPRTGIPAWVRGRMGGRGYGGGRRGGGFKCLRRKGSDQVVATLAGKVTSCVSIKVLAKKPCTKYNCDSQVFRLIGVTRSRKFWCLHLFAVQNSFYIVLFCNKLYWYKNFSNFSHFR